MKRLLLFTLVTTGLAANECCFEPACCSKVYPFHFTVGYTSEKGVGYDAGYGSIELFGSLPTYCNFLPIADVRAHVFEHGDWAYNGGLGLRYRDDCNNIAWGVNAFYDYRDRSATHFHQVGVGLEALAQCWAIRANGYFPFGNDHSSRTTTFTDTDDCTFERKIERHVMWGADLEGEYCLIDCCDFLRLSIGAGPYYYKAKDLDRDLLGVRARLSWSAYDVMYASVITTYDRVFDWIVQGEVGIRIPFGICGRKQKSKYQMTTRCPPVSCCCDFQMMRRMVQPIRRQEIIVLTRKKKTRLIECNTPTPPPPP